MRQEKLDKARLLRHLKRAEREIEKCISELRSYLGQNFSPLRRRVPELSDSFIEDAIKLLDAESGSVLPARVASISERMIGRLQDVSLRYAFLARSYTEKRRADRGFSAPPGGMDEFEYDFGAPAKRYWPFTSSLHESMQLSAKLKTRLATLNEGARRVSIQPGSPPTDA